MEKETKSILDSEVIVHCDDYMSIPTLSMDDISSLEDLAVDQKSSHFRRRSWLAFVSLFLVGAICLWSERPTQASLVEEKGFSVVSTEIGVDEGYEYDLSLESVEAQASQCGGPIQLPPDFTACIIFGGCDPLAQSGPSAQSNTAPLCTETSSTIRGAFQDGISTITGKAFDSTVVLAGILGTVVGNGGVLAGFMMILFGTTFDLICQLAFGDGESPAYTEYDDVVRISGSVFDDKMQSLILKEFKTEYEDLLDLAIDGFDKTDIELIREKAKTFRVLAVQFAEGGFEANALFATAAKTSLLLLRFMMLLSEENSDTTCECQAKRRVLSYRREFLRLWNTQVYGTSSDDSTNTKAVKGSWEWYKEYLLNPANYEYKRENRGGCSNIFLGSYFNQYSAKVRTPNLERDFAKKWSRGGTQWQCYSNQQMKDEAMRRLQGDVQLKLDDMEEKVDEEGNDVGVFIPEVKEFFLDMEKNPGIALCS